MMKKQICVFFATLALIMPSGSWAIAVGRGDIPNDVLDKLEYKAANALSCASRFGSVRNVRVEAIEIRGEQRAKVYGTYQIQGFWGVAPARFEGSLFKNGYTNIYWSEVNGSGDVYSSCLE